MAAHVIQQVRDAIIAQLAAVAPGWELPAKILLHRDRPQDVTACPFVYIQTGDDLDEVASIGYPVLEDMSVQFALVIVTYAIQANDYEAQALKIRRDIERVLYPAVTPNTLGGLVTRLARMGGRVEQDDLGGKPTYAITLDIVVQLRHLITLPDSTIY